jgi:hypothetical protein
MTCDVFTRVLVPKKKLKRGGEIEEVWRITVEKER